MLNRTWSESNGLQHHFSGGAAKHWYGHTGCDGSSKIATFLVDHVRRLFLARPEQTIAQACGRFLASIEGHTAVPGTVLASPLRRQPAHPLEPRRDDCPSQLISCTK